MALKKFYVLDGAELKDLFKELRAGIVADLIGAQAGPATENKLLSRKEVCQILGIGFSALNSRISEGTLNPVRIGKLLKFRQSEIQKIKNHSENGK